MQKGLEKIADFFTPKVNELYTFIVALTCLLVYVFHPEFRSLYGSLLFNEGAGKANISFLGLGLLAVGGFFLSLIHVFVRGKKSPIEKAMMFVFAAIANGVAGIVAGAEMLQLQGPFLLIILPVWNILTGLFSIYQIGLIQNPMTDENASLAEVGMATSYVIIVFTVANFGLRMNWAITFSFCLSFAWGMTFFVNRAVNFFNLRR